MLSAKPPRPLCRRSELVHDWKARLGCDAGEGVGRSQSVIVVRDDLGVLEIFANQFESKAETAHKICGLAQKWQIGDWMGPPTLRYQGLDGLDGATHSPVPRKCGWPLVSLIRPIESEKSAGARPSAAAPWILPPSSASSTKSTSAPNGAVSGGIRACNSPKFSRSCRRTPWIADKVRTHSAFYFVSYAGIRSGAGMDSRDSHPKTAQGGGRGRSATYPAAKDGVDPAMILRRKSFRRHKITEFIMHRQVRHARAGGLTRSMGGLDSSIQKRAGRLGIDLAAPAAT